MGEAVHPAMAQERAQVAHTLAIIADERVIAAQEAAQQAERIGRLAREAGGIYSDEEEVARFVGRTLDQRVDALARAAQRPYFTRVDFIPNGGHKETHYIGKWGVLKSPDFDSVVVDWRSPVANLYYSGQVGPLSYTAPDGAVHGELTLKRHLAVEHGELLSVFDTDVVSQDAYLQQALAAMSPTKLREIVSTIQAEQNIVIRHPLDRPLVVQGVAGSGKTTIALHRIAWLLYAYQRRLAPGQMLILAPSPMFLDYISAVLPDLGVEHVRQDTVVSLLNATLGKEAPRLHPDDALEQVLAQDKTQRACTTQRMQYMGSLRFGEVLEAFLSDVEQHLAPEGDVQFGPVKLYTQAELQRILSDELCAFPLRRRVQELRKYIQRKLQHAAGQIEAWLRQECERRVQALLDTLPDGEARRQRMTKLYDSRDARIRELKDSAKTFVPEVLARFSRLDILPLYAAFLRTPAEQLPAEDRDAWRLVQEHSGILAGDKKARTEDVPALALIARRVAGWGKQDIRHVVIDEAQDLSPLMVWTLKELTGNASFTIVGDLMQGVHAYRGLTGWSQLTADVFGGAATFHELVISYRNTVEIMRFATEVAHRHAPEGQTEPQPVLRHGPEPIVAEVMSSTQAQAIADQVAAWRQEGFGAIALIGRDASECDALMRVLPKALEARLVRADDTVFRTGLSVIPAPLVKGLEFDCVLLPDVSAARWPDEALQARLLYVCLTRPLHRLTCYYTGAPSALLPDERRTAHA